MSRGRVTRASRRYPTARRRSARYGNALLARRPNSLPPHLLPGVTGRQRQDRGPARARIAAAVVLFFVLTTIAGFGLFVASSAAAVGGTVKAYRDLNKKLPDAARVATDTFETTRIYDRNGVLLQEVDDPYTGWRTFKPLDELSQYVIDATVAAEDATFWSHYGIEPLAIVRGALINFSGSGSSGGSTITQQLARGLYPEQIGYDVTLTRKFKEALAAFALDKEFSKQDILTMYLNQIYYGQRSYGIEAAANTYFNKRARELTLAEAALLAGLPQAPSQYDPTVRFELAKQRQRYVLDQMVKYRYITAAEAQEAWNEPVRPKGRRTNAILYAPHFTEYVKQYVIDRFGEDALYEGGLQITTTIDVELQETAEQLVRDGVANLAAYNRNNAAMVAMVPWSGEILAMVGSANFDDPTIGGQINYAVAPRQPGSSIKPVVYAAAFEAGWNPGTVVLDYRIKEPTGSPAQPWYEPQNYSGLNYGAITIRTALANSLNIPAVQATEYVGVARVMDLTQRMGARTSFDRQAELYGLSFGLGSAEIKLVEHTNIYATFANNGRYVPATPILKITDSQGNLVYELDRKNALKNGEQVLKAEHAYQITSILTDAEARAMVFGRGNRFERVQNELGRPTAAKSGTTDEWRDLWTMGYTTDLAVGVWVGRTSGDGSSVDYLPEIDGIDAAGPIWEAMMREMHRNPRWSKYLLGPDERPLPEEFPRPAGIYTGKVCAATGGKPVGSEETRDELLVRGEGPALRCNQLSAFFAEELAAALKDVRANGKYTGNGTGSIYRYAEAVGFSSGEFRGSGQVGTGGVDEPGGFDSAGDSPSIEPRDDT